MAESPRGLGVFVLRVLSGAGCGFGAAMAIRMAQAVNGPPNMTPMGVLAFTGMGTFIGAMVGLEIFANRAAHKAVAEPSDSERRPQATPQLRSETLVAPDWDAFQAERAAGPPLAIEPAAPVSASTIAGLFVVPVLLLIVILGMSFGQDMARGQLRWQDALLATAPFAAMFAILTVSIGGTHFANRRRAQQLREAADRLRLGYANGADDDLRSALSMAGVLPDGQLSNVLAGQAASQSLTVFDHTYSYGHGKQRKTVQQTIACFRFPERWLPGFSLRPQTFSDNLYLWAKPLDFDLASHPTFSREYLLAGENEAAVRKFFTPSLLDHLEEIVGLSVAGRDALLVVYRPRKRVRPDDLPGFLQEAFGVAAAVVKAAR